MDASLTECLKSISDIRHQIKTLGMEDDLYKYATTNSPETAVERTLCLLQLHNATRPSVKRQFEYRSMIVSIYGVLEQYLDSLVIEYLQEVNRITPRYDSCPDSIKKNHIEVSLELVARAQQKSYRGELSVSEIVSHLHSCLADCHPFTLNSHAFTLRRANYRTEVIATTFSRIGITPLINLVRQSRSFQDGILHLFPEQDIGKLSDAVVFQLLDDLADRRNDVAHGNVSEVLSYELLVPYIDLIQATAIAVHEVVSSSLFAQLATHFGSPESRAVAVHNNSIVCLRVNGIVVSRGDLIVGWNDNKSRYVGGPIIDIEIGGSKVTEVDAREQSINAGFEVNFRAKATYTYCIVCAERPPKF